MGSDDPLDRLDTALITARTLADQADALIDQVVSEARAAGRSWTEIGARLGVSKQAARKRFTGAALPPEVSLAPRLQACIARAEQLARAANGRRANIGAANVEAENAGAANVGAEHLLAGLLTDGIAATILAKLGVTGDAIAASTARLFDSDPPATELTCALEAAAHHARAGAADHDLVTVGTEHLLAVLALDHGSRAHRILVDLGVNIADVKKELACYLAPRRRRLRRNRKATTPTCSFCGTAESARRPIVHGPGVTICGVCAERAVQNLDLRTPSRP